MEFNELIQERFSCRSLSDSEIPHEALGRIFEAARLAPTAVNKQPFKVWAVESPEARAKLAETTNYTFGAGVFLVVGGKNEDAWVRQYDERNFADVDASIIATYIMLAIHNEGLRSTWVGHFDVPNSRRHSHRWQTMTSSPSSPSGTLRRRAFPRHATHSENLRWRSSKSCNTKIPRHSGGFFIRNGRSYFMKLNARLPG